MERQVWFREADQRAGRYHFEVRVSPDGLVAEYRQTKMANDTVLTRKFYGTDALEDAQRKFDEDVTREMN